LREAYERGRRKEWGYLFYSEKILFLKMSTPHHGENWKRGGSGVKDSRGVLPEKFGRGVRPASQNPYPYPIYDQNLRFSLPYL